MVSSAAGVGVGSSFEMEFSLVLFKPTASSGGPGKVLPIRGENTQKIRSTKFEIRNKSKIRIPNVQKKGCSKSVPMSNPMKRYAHNFFVLVIRIYSIIICFGFRVPIFGFEPQILSDTPLEGVT